MYDRTMEKIMFKEPYRVRQTPFAVHYGLTSDQTALVHVPKPHRMSPVRLNSMPYYPILTKPEQPWTAGPKETPSLHFERFLTPTKAATTAGRLDVRSPSTRLCKQEKPKLTW